MELVIKLIALLSVLVALWKIWRNFGLRSEMLRRHPPVDYVPPPAAAESWRWGVPPAEVSLEIWNDSDSSVVNLPSSLPVSQVVASLFGYLLFAGSLVLLVRSLFDDGNDTPLTVRMGVFTFLLLCGWGLTFTNALVVRVELTPDRAIILMRHGIVLNREITIRRSPGLEFQCSVQSALAMARRQRSPDVYLAWSGAVIGKRVMLMCTPAQGGWIRDGLEHWARSAPPET